MNDTALTLTVLEVVMAAASLVMALLMRPWRMLTLALLTPTLASLVLLPWCWLLPQHLPVGMSVQLSGASLLVLMLGWPLAVPVLALVAVAVWLLGHANATAVLSQWVWVGLLPATVSMLEGVLIRRFLAPNIFVYTLGRGFLGTAVAVFLAGVLHEMSYRLMGGVTLHDALVARWLMAWGDAFLTGLLAAVFVAFAPQWLATWSDDKYLRPPA